MKQKNKNCTRILIVPEYFLSKCKACAVSSHRKINSVFTGEKVCIFPFMKSWTPSFGKFLSQKAFERPLGSTAYSLSLSPSSYNQDWVPGDVNFELPLALACRVIWGKLLIFSKPQLPHLSKERCTLVCWALPAGTLQKYKTLLWHCSGTFLDKGHLVYRCSMASRKNYICYVGQIEQDLLRDLKTLLAFRKPFLILWRKKGSETWPSGLNTLLSCTVLGLWIILMESIFFIHKMGIIIIIISVSWSCSDK